jgi:integrase/recombinase XerD
MSTGLILDFTKHLEQTGKSNSTIIAYKKDLEQVHSHLDRDLHEVNLEDLSQAIKALQTRHGFTPKTVSRKINSLRTFYRFLNTLGKISHNPADQMEHPKFTPKPPRVLSQVEYLALREVSRSNKRLFTMIELLLQTGIRIGELSRVRVKHLELETKPLLHVEAYSSLDARRIPLNSKIQDLIQEYLETLKASHSEHPLFPTRDGKPIIIRNIRSSIDRALIKAGIEDASVNDLRNTFIVGQLKAGVSLDFLAEIVGHRSKTTTQKYTELLAEAYTPTGKIELIVL